MGVVIVLILNVNAVKQRTLRVRREVSISNVKVLLNFVEKGAEESVRIHGVLIPITLYVSKV